MWIQFFSFFLYQGIELVEWSKLGDNEALSLLYTKVFSVYLCVGYYLSISEFIPRRI